MEKNSYFDNFFIFPIKVVSKFFKIDSLTYVLRAPVNQTHNLCSIYSLCLSLDFPSINSSSRSLIKYYHILYAC